MGVMLRWTSFKLVLMSISGFVAQTKVDVLLITQILSSIVLFVCEHDPLVLTSHSKLTDYAL